MTQKTNTELPTGYDYAWIDGGATRILLPREQVARLRAEEDERFKREASNAWHSVPSSVVSAKVEEAAKKRALEEEAEKQHVLELWTERPKPGWYRVLCNPEKVMRESTEGELSLRTPDADVQKRHRLARERLFSAGPNRRIARPPSWRQDVEELAQSMPNFKAPIELVANALALAEATHAPVRIPPILLLGPPGVGKTYFTQQIATLMSVASGTISYDQPHAGGGLKGHDKSWANTESGMLFNLICLGDAANPVVLLDEIDKAGILSSKGTHPLAELHGALEVQTAKCTRDISVDIEFDASLVTYVATANDARRLDSPILSRFEIFHIPAPDPRTGLIIAENVVRQVLARLRLQERIHVQRKGLYVLAHLSPRLIHRTVEKAVAASVAAGRDEVSAREIDAIVGIDSDLPSLH